MFAPRGANSPPARHRREAPALWREGKRVPGGAKGSVCPVGTWARRDQSDPKRGSETMSATVREARMIEQPDNLGPKAQSDPKVRRREASALWAVARSAKRPAGVSKYKGCARPARRTPILRGQRNHERAEGKRQPCGLLRESAKRPRRRTAKRAVGAAPAPSATIERA